MAEHVALLARREVRHKRRARRCTPLPTPASSLMLPLRSLAASRAPLALDRLRFEHRDHGERRP